MSRELLARSSVKQCAAPAKSTQSNGSLTHYTLLSFADFFPIWDLIIPITAHEPKDTFQATAAVRCFQANEEIGRGVFSFTMIDFAYKPSSNIQLCLGHLQPVFHCLAYGQTSKIPMTFA